MSFYSWLFTKKIANRFFLRVFKLPVPEWFVGQSGSSKVERDYFDDDWNPDLYIMLMWRLFVCLFVTFRHHTIFPIFIVMMIAMLMMVIQRKKRSSKVERLFR